MVPGLLRAGLRLRPRLPVDPRHGLDGSEWVIDGQKVWTSSADRANWIFVLARTDPDAPRHSGISFLLVPLDQPGIEVRPIRMINGDAEFAEVFFTGARTRADYVVGPVNSGWKVAQTLLGFERGDEAATLPLLFRAELDRLIALVREKGLESDPLVRQELTALPVVGGDPALPRLSGADRTRFRRGTRAGGIGLQIDLERASPAGDGAGDERARTIGSGAGRSRSAARLPYR